MEKFRDIKSSDKPLFPRPPPSFRGVTTASTNSQFDVFTALAPYRRNCLTMLLTTVLSLVQSGAMTRRKTLIWKKSSFNQPRGDLKSKVLPMEQGSDALVVETQVMRRKQPQPLGPEHFTIVEEHGIKFITTNSPSTTTVIRHDLPLLAKQIDLSRNYYERLREQEKSPQPKDVRRLFPCLDFYCTDQDIERLMACPSTNSGPEAQSILKTLTGMKAGSVARYGRKITRKTRQHRNRKNASK